MHGILASSVMVVLWRCSLGSVVSSITATVPQLVIPTGVLQQNANTSELETPTSDSAIQLAFLNGELRAIALSNRPETCHDVKLDYQHEPRIRRHLVFIIERYFIRCGWLDLPPLSCLVVCVGCGARERGQASLATRCKAVDELGGPIFLLERQVFQVEMACGARTW